MLDIFTFKVYSLCFFDTLISYLQSLTSESTRVGKILNWTIQLIDSGIVRDLKKVKIIRFPFPNSHTGTVLES